MANSPHSFRSAPRNIEFNLNLFIGLKVKHIDKIDGYDIPYVNLLRTRNEQKYSYHNVYDFIATLRKELLAGIKLLGLVIYCIVLSYVADVEYVADFKHWVRTSRKCTDIYKYWHGQLVYSVNMLYSSVHFSTVSVYIDNNFNLVVH
jgi:hypothetical protein